MGSDGGGGGLVVLGVAQPELRQDVQGALAVPAGVLVVAQCSVCMSGLPERPAAYRPARPLPVTRSSPILWNDERARRAVLITAHQVPEGHSSVS